MNTPTHHAAHDKGYLLCVLWHTPNAEIKAWYRNMKEDLHDVIELMQMRKMIDLIFTGENSIEDLVQFSQQMASDKTNIPKYIIWRGSLYSRIFRDPTNGDHLVELHKDVELDNALKSQDGLKSIDLLNQCLASRQLRAPTLHHMLSRFWADKTHEWESVICPALSVQALHTLLTLAPSKHHPHSHKSDSYRRLLAELIQGEQRLAVVEQAAKKRQIVALYRITKWDECIEHSKSRERAACLAIDLEV